MPGINLLLSRRAVRFWRTLAVLVVAYLRRLARIWGPQRLLRLLSCQWGPSYQTGAASPFCTASLDAPTYPRVWNLKPPSWVEIKSQQLHVALGFKRRSLFFSRIQIQDGRVFPVSLMLFFHVFPCFSTISSFPTGAMTERSRFCSLYFAPWLKPLEVHFPSRRAWSFQG